MIEINKYSIGEGEIIMHLDSTGFIVFAICLSIVCGFALAYFVKETIYKHYRNYVKEKSELYKNIVNVNSKYRFNSIEKEKSFIKNCNSKMQFDRANAADYLVSITVGSYDWITPLFAMTEQNRVKYRRYCEEIKEIEKKKVKIPNVAFKRLYYRIMVEECNKVKLYPTIDPVVSVTFTYISPKGQRRYQKTTVFYKPDLNIILVTVNRMKEKKKTVKYQRQILTDSLRYDILKRDGFSCCICGASKSDGVKLEVDHIIPVSKGGLTEPSNLRTLCQRCNQGKKAKYDANGIN